MLVFETCVSATVLWNTLPLRPHVAYFSPAFSWDDAVVVTISDASFFQEQEQLDGITDNFKSQQACISALAPGNALNAGKMIFTLRVGVRRGSEEFAAVH